MVNRLLLGCVALLASSAARADVIVLSAAAVRPPLLAAADLVRGHGGALRPEFGTAGAIRDRILHGATVDLVVLPPAGLDQLAQRGLVVRDSMRALGTVRLGVAVPARAVHPAIATEAQVRATLLAAPSIGLADPATGATTGVYLAALLTRMGLADTLRPKIHLYPDGTEAMRALARGDVALAVGQISEIKPVPGVDLVGPLAAPLQLCTVYAAGEATHAASPQQAAALLALLVSPSLAPAFAAAGLDPPSDTSAPGACGR
jgi:molybdate transport system substrate-binding protein